MSLLAMEPPLVVAATCTDDRADTVAYSDAAGWRQTVHHKRPKPS